MPKGAYKLLIKAADSELLLNGIISVMGAITSLSMRNTAISIQHYVSPVA